MAWLRATGSRLPLLQGSLLALVSPARTCAEPLAVISTPAAASWLLLQKQIGCTKLALCEQKLDDPQMLL